MKWKRNRIVLAALFVAAVCGLGVSVMYRFSSRPARTTAHDIKTLHLTELLRANSLLPTLDIARVNLLCAEDLPNSSRRALDVEVSTLDSWSRHVASETTRHWYRFRQNPKEFNHSKGFFRMLMMAVVLTEDFHIQYDPTMRMSAPSASSEDRFFASADSVFLCGLLGPAHKGTCSSLPVLYVALGRRLGYPLYLVTTKGHLFVR